jgi:glutamate-ammonia-ligase adenylyltransferase
MILCRRNHHPPASVAETGPAFQKKFMDEKIERLAETLAGETREEKLAEAFRALRFTDPAKAAVLWKRLLPAEGPERFPRQNIAALMGELAASSDPDTALLNLTRFVEATIAPRQFLHSVFLAKPLCRLLVTIFSCSYHLTDILARNPGYLSWLIETDTLGRTKAHSAYRAELIRQTESFRDARRRLNSVKRYLRRETLRVGARDLMGLSPVEEVTAELSFLADAVIETIAEMAFEETAERSGLGPTAWSYDQAVPFHRFAIISLGKLGGTELNYSSDIDLLYACDVTEGEREESFYTALAQRITDLLSSPTEEGTLYRVDLRLRPDGDSGPLIVTLAEHLNYLQRRAKPWEKQSLIKARFTAGNRRVGEAFIEGCENAIYTPIPSIDPLDEIVTMRERWTSYLSDEERAANIKLMSGGIRDIEFIAQGLQLVHGRNRPEIRSRNTLESLERLCHYGLLSPEVKETLERSYRLFRTVEHRIQMLQNIRAHTLPSLESDLVTMGARVARSALGGVTAENFRAELSRALSEVQHIFDGFFKGRDPGNIPLLLSLPANDGAVEDILAKYGLLEGEQAHRFLSSLVFGDFPRLEGIETLAAAARALPIILGKVSETPDPSLTLRNLVRIVKATGAVRSTLDILGGGGDFLRLLLDVAALSTVLSDILVRRIELLDVLAEGAPPGEPPRPQGNDHPFGEELERWFEENLLFIHCQHPMLSDGPKVIGLLLSGVVEKSLKALFDRAAGGGLDLALFSAGSLGSWNVRFGSDLDLIAVTSEAGAAPNASAVVRSLIEGAQEAHLPSIDMRLRGEGENAPLVQTVDYLERYIDGRAEPWEIIAYTKCRFLCGNAKTAAAFDGILTTSLPRVFMRPGWHGRVREARAKLESLSRSPWDVKHAPGGLYDIDFMRSVRALTGRDGLAEGEPFTIEKAHQLYRMIEHAAALHGLPYPPLPEREAFFERYFARLFGDRVRGEGSFLDRLGSIKRDVRKIYERFFERIA